MSTIYTIGHSTRSIDEFVAMLHAHDVVRLVDIRTIPKSRRNPQFAQDALRTSLADAGIEYAYLKDLGGLRPKQAETVNAGWRNQSFRNYADYMQSATFAEAVDELVVLAERAPTAIMCAEAVPWRCHRSLVGDALLVRGFEVIDIMSLTSAKPHPLTPFANVSETTITYPAETTTSA